MKIQQWIDEFEKKVPLELQEDWDNCGIQAGRTSKELTGVIFALDLTQEVINYAKENKANLIVTHHPILFKGEKKITQEKIVTDLVLQAIEEGFVLYAAHTNFDFVDGGVNDILAELCRVNIEGPLEKHLDKSSFDKVSRGMGVYGSIVSQSFQDYAEFLKEKLEMDHIVVYGDLNRKISRVAILGGSGMDFAEAALEKDCDAIITADVKYHDASEFVTRGLNIYDVGHYFSEFCTLPKLEKWSEEIAPSMSKGIVSDTKERMRKVV